MATQLSARDGAILDRALSRPRKPNAALRRAAESARPKLEASAMPRAQPTIPAALLDLGAADLVRRIRDKTGEPLKDISARIGLDPSSLYRVRNETSQERVWRALARLAVEVGAV